MAAVLEVVDSFADVALAQLLSNQTCLHGIDPLLADNSIFGRLEGLGVVEVDTVEGWRDLGLLSLEELRLGDWHD